MSYQVLARKWRPKKFAELMGQEHVVSVLTNALTQQRLHHAYLFTGTRGVGKTTIARIFAKSLNCLQGVTAEPCGQCEACVDIDQGRFVDLLEIDAASRTKVDDTREILDNVQYAPSRGRYKVYLIDEVHMLSRSSFNALLKTLEEPPSHVKFILATTDPQKLPVTVLSRCLQFHLKALTVEQIKTQLNTILQAENVTAEDSAVAMLAKAAKGSMRDSLSLTDQAIAQGQGNILLANVQQMLGGIDQHWPYKILIQLVKCDSQSLMALSQEIASYSPNYSRLMAEFIQLLHHIAIAQVVESNFDLAPEHEGLLKKFCQAMRPDDVQLYYQIALNGRKDLPYAADEQAAFDMTLLRLLAFKPMSKLDSQQQVQGEQRHDIQLDDELPETSVTSSELNAKPLSELSKPVTVEIQPNAESVEQNQSAKENIHAEQNVEQHNSQHTEQAQLDDNASEQALAEQMREVEHVAREQGFQPPQNVEASPVQQPVVNHDNAIETEQPSFPTNASPVEAVLASRNMLRSKKKQLESQSKKSIDAEARHEPQKPEKVIDPSVPALEEITHQEYQPETIDPSIIRNANQVDKWANMIDNMALNGRIRQLAIKSTICDTSTDNTLVLQLNQSTKHLQSEKAHEQLQEEISDLLNKPIEVIINVVEDTVDDPFQIQTDINEKRFDYAKQLLKEDATVQHFEQHFQATINEQSIVAK